MRVVILRDYAQKNFPFTPLLDYASEVEKITTSKVNSTDNVIGCQGRCFFSYLTDFSYFLRKRNSEDCRTGQKMTFLKGGVDGFSYFH